MRIISGSLRGRRLEPPPGMTTRPTTDKVKESLFNIVQFELPDARVLDLFAGSGAIGIEALSRGAAGCVFCDRSEPAVRAVKANLRKCRLEKQAVVMKGEARLAVPAVKRMLAAQTGSLAGEANGAQNRTGEQAVDPAPEQTMEGNENRPKLIIFLDPPYDKGLELQVLEAVMSEDLLQEGDLVILETSLSSDLTPLTALGLEIFKEKNYKNQRHIFMRKAAI